MAANKFPFVQAFPPHFSLAHLNGKSGFTINGVVAGDRAGFSVSGAGDVNADGIADFLIGTYVSGKSYVVFGSKSGWPAVISLSNLTGSNGFSISGIGVNVISVDGAGDVNDDGIDDILIGASDVNNYAGQSHVVFGSKSAWPSALSLSNLNGSNGFAINGINSGDWSGCSVSRAGDVNGDSIDDILIGASGANNYTGQTYVVFGSKSAWPAVINLNNLNGSNGFAIGGINSRDFSGLAVSNAGDVNNDGVDDILIGAPYANNKGNYAGQSYVVFGSKSGWQISSISLGILNGKNGFAINGINHNDKNGNSVSRAGDVNGDGIDDILIGASGGNNQTGQSYVVFGSKSGWQVPSISLDTLNGKNGFTINGIKSGDLSGISVSGAGDINGDGIDDILIGASNGNDGTGQGNIVFGIKGEFPAVIDLAKLNGLNGFIVDGNNSSDNAGFSVSRAGDVNGDGITDFLIGSFRTNPIGQSYLVFGGNPANFTSAPTQSPTSSTPSHPTPMPSPPTAPSMNSQPFLSTDALHLLEIIIPTFIGLSCITGIAAYGFYRYKHHQDHADLGHSTLVQPLLAEEVAANVPLE